MSSELTIILKDAERTYKQKFLIYEDITFGITVDPLILRCIEEASVNFKGEPEDIIIKAHAIYK